MPKGINYQEVEIRLASFTKWDNPHVKPDELAAAGFYFIEEKNMVRCFKCRLEIHQWSNGDIPLLEHYKWQVNCYYIREVLGKDFIGDPGHVQTLETFRKYLARPRRLSEMITIGKFQEKHPWDPKNIKLSCLDKRLETFDTWAKESIVTRESLADAGFFYTHYQDRVMCFYCGGGLKDWEADQDPWVEHAKWFARCNFLKMTKGTAYIDNICGSNLQSIKGMLQIVSLPDRRLPSMSTMKEIWGKQRAVLPSFPWTPKYPEFICLDKRLETYANWPKESLITKNSLAEAGFIYTQRQDRVICFQCSKELSGWRMSHDVWDRHIRQSPSCPFLRMTKGKTYVRNNHRQLMPLKEPAPLKGYWQYISIIPYNVGRGILHALWTHCRSIGGCLSYLVYFMFRGKPTANSA